MKKTAVLTAMLAMTAGTLSATPPGYPIATSAHDFTAAYVGQGGSFTNPNRCTTCHAAHNAKRTVPLWARDTPANNSNWVIWSADGAGTTLDAVAETGDDVSGGKAYLSGNELAQSKTGLCMSCHDGTIAINAVPDPTMDDHAGTPGTPTLFSEAGAVFMDPNFRGKWGRDLRNMHPIGKFVAFGNPGWQASIGVGNTGSGSSVALEGPNGDRVGCTSCHSMHSSAPDSMKILRGGQICLSCHDR